VAVSVELIREEGRARVGAATAAELPSRVTVGERSYDLHKDRITPEGGLEGCVGCGHPELYTQKDFPRWLGIVIVVVAAILAPRTRYISLFVAAGLDFLLYHLAPNMVVCYVCDTRHRRFHTSPKHPRFDREIEERLKYGDRAVMGRPMREGGTADAPEPEH
jgi:hypothetical protein